ncbi:unnamed protein product [Phytomonas sp. Hart1]|nr:unnamed protein product [Phytomonas sp. Hart1]|eukprot:CCW70248.1 unnamed protein product [Phytomonas sp. isolate Hart1]
MLGPLDGLVRSIVFPRPEKSTYTASTHPDALLHISCVCCNDHTETGSYTYGYLFTQPSATHLLIYAHPNAVDIGMIYNEMKNLSEEAKIDVLLFEYSGYGLTHTEVSEESMNRDMLGSYYFARDHLHVPPDRIVLCGRSIGAAVVVQLFAGLPKHQVPSLVILQCPFTSLSECMQEFSKNAVSIVNFLGYNWFRTIDIIANVQSPIVLHHGTIDNIVPISHTYALKDKRTVETHPCKTHLYLDKDRGHNNLRRSTLIQILHERIEISGLRPLHTIWPSFAVSHPPVSTLLFPLDITKFNEVCDKWNKIFNLADTLQNKESWFVILTASVCVFAAKAAREWQVYSDLIKRNSCNRSLKSRCSKNDFLIRCMTSWYNPLGIYIPIPGHSGYSEALVFGCSVPPNRWSSFDIAWDFISHDVSNVLFMIVEFKPTAGLLKAMGMVLSSAPDLLGMSKDEIPNFIHPDLVENIQVECERMVAFMPSHMSTSFEFLLNDLEKNSEALMSAKASRLHDTSFDHVVYKELCEWMNPYIKQPEQMSAIANEVSWDYYLFKARILMSRFSLHMDMDWRELEDFLQTGAVLVKIYDCFCRYFVYPSEPSCRLHP